MTLVVSSQKAPKPNVGLQGDCGEHQRSQMTDPRAAMSQEIADLLAATDRPQDEMFNEAAAIVCRAFADTCIVALLSEDRRNLHPLGLGARDSEMRAELD